MCHCTVSQPPVAVACHGVDADDLTHERLKVQAEQERLSGSVQLLEARLRERLDALERTENRLDAKESLQVIMKLRLCMCICGLGTGEVKEHVGMSSASGSRSQHGYTLWKDLSSPTTCNRLLAH